MLSPMGERSAANEPNVVFGTDGPDLIAPKKTSRGVIGSATNGPDRVEAGLGADSVSTGGGNDELIGDR